MADQTSQELDFNIDCRKDSFVASQQKAKEIFSRLCSSTSTVDMFLMGAIKELHEMSYLIKKPESKKLLNKLFACFEVNKARKVADNFARSLVSDCFEENVFDNSAVNSFFFDAPFFKLLFVENCKNEDFSRLKTAIFDDNSRDQRIMLSVMNLSYYNNLKDEESALNFINQDLKDAGFECLNKKREIDSLVMQCIAKEDKLNRDYDLTLNVGGMREISKLLKVKSFEMGRRI